MMFKYILEMLPICYYGLMVLINCSESDLPSYKPVRTLLVYWSISCGIPNGIFCTGVPLSIVRWSMRNVSST
jgi:hypothetical protein